jgi:hypothetical protein
MATAQCRRCTRTKSSVDRSGLCWSCRAPKRARVRTTQRRAEVRNPPRPPYGLVPGACALCGGPVRPPRRTWCSQDCVDTWNLATSPEMATQQLAALHGPACADCGGEREPEDYGVELDHRRPLWSLDEAERLELWWWLPGNLQLLGPRCHRAKTAREATARAYMRRAQAEGRQVRYAG